ncbi:unnamed protein product [Medioppia subpectinata]|uniref:Uncharacterized protein n=1 Tax=Medioppia subpectinata TaxID=1979941 RepID=A0A7R9LVI2_9ACAR|nr:unnamed protein product [Medioppia subpectinata]CAG2122085.1 unnamed protein product [Medioppia subpectinata]
MASRRSRWRCRRRTGPHTTLWAEFWAREV